MSTDSSHFGRAYHVANPNANVSFDTLAQAVETFAGKPVRRLPYKEWRTLISNDESSPLNILWSSFPEEDTVRSFIVLVHCEDESVGGIQTLLVVCIRRRCDG